MPGEDSQGRHLREQIRVWGSDLTLHPIQIDDVLLVASELMSNAVRASEGGSPIDVNVIKSDVGISVRVENIGKGFEVDSLPEPLREQFGGRGIAIMRALGSVSVNQVGNKTAVTVILPIPPDTAGEVSPPRLKP